MNGSDVWGSSAPYGDVLLFPCSNGIFTKEGVLSLQNCHSLFDESLQITLEKNYQVSFGIFLFLYLYSYRYHSPLHGAS